MPLWTPPKVSRQQADEAAKDAAEVRLAAALAGQLKWWTDELKQIDEHLEMVWFDAGVKIPGVVPNRYHVLRWSETAPVTIIPITGPEGEFVEPNSSVFDRLKQGDMWSERSVRAREEAQAKVARAAERQRAREDEARQEEMVERLLAATRTQVSMNRDSPWTQNASAASRRDAAARKKLRNGARAA